MPELIRPAIARGRLRTRLHELREARGLSPEVVEREMGWPVSTLHDIETGAQIISPLEVERLLGIYGVADDREVSDVALLAQIARSTNWCARHGLTDEYQQFLGFAGEAAQISVYQSSVVPGLLQTERYASAATAAILNKDPDHPDVVARVQLRRERQRVVEDRIRDGTAPELFVIVDEIVLRRPIGGYEVLRQQLDRLLAEGSRPHVALVVLLTERGGHVGLGGVFEFLEFADERDRDMVFIESMARDFIIRDAGIIDLYRNNVRELRATGLTGDDALRFIEQTRHDTN